MRTAPMAWALLLLAAATFARAEGPVGIAYVEAPESSSGVCTGPSPAAAFDCARARCAVRCVAPARCLREAWCFPAGWSVDVFVQDANGLHGHEFSCGWPSRALAVRAGELLCEDADAVRRPVCETVRLFDPSGREHAPDGAAR